MLRSISTILHDYGSLGVGELMSRVVHDLTSAQKKVSFHRVVDGELSAVENKKNFLEDDDETRSYGMDHAQGRLWTVSGSMGYEHQWQCFMGRYSSYDLESSVGS